MVNGHAWLLIIGLIVFGQIHISSLYSEVVIEKTSVKKVQYKSYGAFNKHEENYT